MRHHLNLFSLSACALAASLMVAGCGGGAVTTDTTPPTVAITDNISVAVATGAVTFTFTFSENVGTSFVVEDVTVAGGSAGALTKVDATHYTLVITPTANATGTISVGVGAAKFKDITLNDNTAAANASQAFDTVAAPITTVLATFDEAIAPAFAGFEGAAASIASGPSGGSGNALRVLRTGGQPWAGAELPGLTLNVSATANTVSARVYSPLAGIPVVLKLEGTGNSTTEIQASQTVVVGWQTLSWVIPAGEIGPVRNKVVFLPHLGTVGTGQEFYFDDVKLLGGGAAPAPGGCTPAALPALITFDSDCTVLTGFEGTSAATVVADPAGGGNMVGKVVKPAGSAAAFYAGVTVSNGANFSISTIPFTASSARVSMRVYSAYAGMRVHLKLEKVGDPGTNVQHDAFTTLTNQWETLTFNLVETATHFNPSGPTTYNASQPTANFVLGAIYNKANVFFDYGLGSAASGAYAPMPEERTYYFDDLKFVP